MKFEERHEFEQSADTVMKMYSDPVFFDRKYRDLGTIACQLLDRSESGNHFSVRYQLEMESNAPLPEAAKKVIGGTINMIQTDSWDIQARKGRIEIEIKGAPIKVHADMSLVDEAGKGVNIQSWEVSCRIPLIGKKIEAAVAEDIKIKSRKDLAVSRNIIADY